MLQTKIKIDDNIKVSNNIYNFLMPEKVYFKTDEKINKFADNFVYKGDYITDNIISPISGFIKNNNNLIEILNDYRELKRNDKGINKIKDKYSFKEIENILKKINNKENIKNKNELIINAISSNPYDITNIFLFRENIYMLLETLNALKNSIDIQKATIYVSSNYNSIITKILNQIGTFPNINIRIVETIYPLSNNDALRYYFKKFKSFIISLNDLYSIGYYLKNDILPLEKLITISGPLVLNPLIIYTKLGTKLKDILNIIEIKENAKKVYILNNLINGISLDLDNYYIVNNTSAILIIEENKIKPFKCIKCGLCYKVCPLKTTPNSNKCIKCGLCSYNCPAKIDLLGDKL